MDEPTIQLCPHCCVVATKHGPFTCTWSGGEDVADVDVSLSTCKLDGDRLAGFKLCVAHHLDEPQQLGRRRGQECRCLRSHQ